MASLIQQAATSSLTSRSVALTGVGAGNGLVAIIAIQSQGNTVSAVTDTQSNTWQFAIGNVFGIDVEIWYAFNVAAGSTTVSFTETGGATISSMMEVTEWSGLGAYVTTNTANSAASPNVSGSLTPTVGDVLIGGIAANSATTRTLDTSAGWAGITPGTQFSFGSSYAAYLVAVNTSSAQASWTTASGANTGGVIAGFSSVAPPTTAAWYKF